MNSLTYLLARNKTNPPAVDPIRMDYPSQCRFDSWNAGFSAFEAGIPLDGCQRKGRAKPLWRQGWLAAQAIEKLMAEQSAGKGEW